MGRGAHADNNGHNRPHGVRRPSNVFESSTLTGVKVSWPAFQQSMQSAVSMTRRYEAADIDGHLNDLVVRNYDAKLRETAEQADVIASHAAKRVGLDTTKHKHHIREEVITTAQELVEAEVSNFTPAGGVIDVLLRDWKNDKQKYSRAKLIEHEALQRGDFRTAKRARWVKRKLFLKRALTVAAAAETVMFAADLLIHADSPVLLGMSGSTTALALGAAIPIIKTAWRTLRPVAREEIKREHESKLKPIWKFADHLKDTALEAPSYSELYESPDGQEESEPAQMAA
jgi:hypothetical protein